MFIAKIVTYLTELFLKKRYKTLPEFYMPQFICCSWICLFEIFSLAISVFSSRVCSINNPTKHFVIKNDKDIKQQTPPCQHKEVEVRLVEFLSEDHLQHGSEALPSMGVATRHDLVDLFQLVV